MAHEPQNQQFNTPVSINSLMVGQTIWYKLLSGRTGDDVSLKETKILSVGKKYFETEEGSLGRFFKDTLKHDNGKYFEMYKIYLSKEQYDDETEADLIYSELRKYFSKYSKPNMDISKLRDILSIIRS